MNLALILVCILLFIVINAFANYSAIKSMKKLQKIIEIVYDRSYTDEIGNAMYYIDEIRVKKIKEVLE